MFGKRVTPHPETCPRCPNRYSKTGCPFWLEEPVTEDNIATGESRVITGCMIPHIPRWIRASIVSGNRSAAALESTRNAMDKTLEAVRKDLARVHRVNTAIQLQQRGATTPGVADMSDAVTAIEHHDEDENAGD